MATINSNSDPDSSSPEPIFDTYDYRLNPVQPKFKFTETPWTPQQVLNFWEAEHGPLSDSWRERFLKDVFVLEMCNHHPGLIREAIENQRKTEAALAYIYATQDRNLEAVEKLLDERRPNHAIGIVNAHHGVRTTDPFDPKREDLLFKCRSCNLKLSLLRKSNDAGRENTCKSCTGEDDEDTYR
jgi:hypothetical protein